MKYHAFYVDNNILVRVVNKNMTRYEKVNNLVTLYNEDEIIGYNIFDQNLNVDAGLIANNEIIHGIITDVTTNNDLELDKTNYFVVGHVIECEKHPDSSKLNITKVDVKDEVLQIVCGASNVALNQKVVVAKVGAVLKDGTWIQPGKLLKVSSNGMICSSKELGITEVSQGILVLDDSYIVGQPFCNEN